MKSSELREIIMTWLLPGVRKRRGMLRMKLLGFDVCFYWPMPDWGWGFHLMIWGYGFDFDFPPFDFFWIHEDHWYWLPEPPKQEE